MDGMDGMAKWAHLDTNEQYKWRYLPIPGKGALR
jgi:hypothetical protein